MILSDYLNVAGQILIPLLFGVAITLVISEIKHNRRW